MSRTTAMNPGRLFADIYLLRPSAYRHACENPRSGLWAVLLLVATGLQYGTWTAVFQRALGLDIKGIPVAQIPDRVLLAGNLVSGVIVVLIFHGGVTLVVWLMARAVGGPGKLAELYRATGYLLALSWLALPGLALDSASQQTPTSHVHLHELYFVLGLLAGLLVCSGLYQLLRESQRILPWRAATGTFLVVLFCYSILLLVEG